MKNVILLYFKLCILILLSFPLIIHFDPVWAANQPEIMITHDIKITFGGLVVINDTVSILNTGTTSLNHFQIGFPNSLSKNFEAIKAQSIASNPLSINLVGNDPITNIYWFDILFPQDIAVGADYDFYVTYAFSQLTTHNSTTLENTVYFPEYPAVTSNVTSCESHLRFAEGTAFANSSWGNTTSALLAPLQANYNLSGWATYTGSQRVIECPFAVRNIILDSWGNSLYYDTYHIRNTGSQILYFFDFPLPSDTNDVIAYDDFGSLSVFVSTSGESTAARVTFRYPLRGDDRTIPNQDEYTVTVHYQQPTQEQLTETSPFSDLSLYLQVLSSQNFIIDKQTIYVTLPEGAKYLQVTPTPLNTSTLLTPSISYTTHKVTPFTTFPISLQYEFNIFWAAFRPTLWLGVVILGFAAIIFIRKQKQVSTAAIPDPNISLVQSLVEACGERTGLWNQIETLENDFDNRRIRRKDFNRRRRILIQRLGTITNEITTLSKRVSALGSQYQEHVTRLTQAETEYQATRTEITRLRTQLRRGQLSTNAYKKEKSDHGVILQRIKATIDDIVFDLKKIVS